MPVITRSMDYSALVLGNGERADRLRAAPLFRALRDMGIPVTAELGRPALLEALRDAVQRVADEIAPKVRKRPVTLDPTIAATAAALIASRHAEKGARNTRKDITRAPSTPIVLTRI